VSEPLALYVHWPFCVSKCPYCDFNSHVREEVDQDAWREALLADLAHEAALLPDRELTSIFFGGGTPSLMPPATVAAMIEAAGRHWRRSSNTEITLEANPSSVEAARFADLASAGVNRVSLGLQAFDDTALAFLGRAHGAAEGLKALHTAQRHFSRTSFDLIYALPGQSETDWSHDLDRAIALGTEHLSLYQLTIEPGTRFATLAAQGKLKPLDPDAGAALFEMTQDRSEAAGLIPYEISNHARAGAESRHNLTYWRYGDYAGIGPGAHGRRGGLATTRHKKPENWIAAVTGRGNGLQSEDVLNPQDKAYEALLMGLRLTEGVDMARNTLASHIDWKAFETLEKVGLVTRDRDRIATTRQGRSVLDGILREILL
jgi:oxygen-independent coproporphyrinogen-3 oxidase